jgi:hypothetical protein
MSHRAILDHTCHFPHFIPSSPHLLGFLGVLTQERVVPHFMGRRGQRPRGLWLAKYKILIINLPDAHPKRS